MGAEMDAPYVKGDGSQPSSSEPAAGTMEQFRAMIRRVLADRHDRPSLVAEIACVVGAEILEGIRPPGADINSVELARTFRTSRTPTREALLLLEKEGLVEILSRRRPRVAAPSVANIRELYEARAAIMEVIVTDVVRRADKAAFKQLHAVIESLRTSSACGNLEDYFWAGLRFHELLVELSGNDTMQRMLNSLILRTLPFRRLSLCQPHRLERSYEDHSRLLRAIEEGDEVLAAALIRANMMGGYRSIEPLLKAGVK